MDDIDSNYDIGEDDCNNDIRSDNSDVNENEKDNLREDHDIHLD